MLRQTFEYRKPESAADALGMRRSITGALYIAGGTDVVPLMQYGVLDPQVLIPLESLPGLQAITQRDGQLMIGSAVTLYALQSYAEKQLPLLGLAGAARAVASPQIRRIGTVAGNLLQQNRCFYYNQTADWRRGIERCYKTGGNICHQAPASPDCRALYYADLAPILLAMQASLMTSAGVMSLERAGGNKRQDVGELIEAIVIPAVEEIYFTAFRKRAVRGAIDFALANAALTLHKGKAVRLVMGAMNPQPVFLTETAALLEQVVQADMPFPESVYAAAEKEARRLARPIREAGVSGTVKMGAVSVVLEVIRDLEEFLRSPEYTDNI